LKVKRITPPSFLGEGAGGEEIKKFIYIHINFPFLFHSPVVKKKMFSFIKIIIIKNNFHH
jgi:hypothetical protein